MRDSVPDRRGEAPELDGSVRGVSYRVRGRVQGVAFRWFGRRTADELGVRGWIRNRPDGDVEGEAFGESEALGRFLARIRRGPEAARVAGLEWREIAERDASTSFEIRY